ncbi:hypothetical protein HF078_06910 [Bacillus sp. RO2]|uniref:hypothetical protein n=1 Tax=Bacillus sp. RO2 TaxID=2723913 RepID=UPI00145F3C1D|nr:hypothetical protein [Bacillus sp. RO2]NMH72796.1 hypothetical protein [Bacillus sp. RO2]
MNTRDRILKDGNYKNEKTIDNTMRKKYSPQTLSSRYIPLRDFIYLCIILVIICIAVISMTLSDSSRAGENLNFAATSVSIVLAILAIVITLTDSYGQKENIKKLEEVSHEMDSSVRNTQLILSKTFEKSEEHIKELITLKEELKKHYEESINELQNKIHDAYDQSGVIDKDKFDKIVEQSLREANKKIKNERNYKKESREDIASYVVKEIESKHGYGNIPKEDIEIAIKDTLTMIDYIEPDILKYEVEKMFKYMLDKGYIHQFKNGYSTLPF